MDSLPTPAEPSTEPRAEEIRKPKKSSKRSHNGHSSSSGNGQKSAGARKSGPFVFEEESKELPFRESIPKQADESFEEPFADASIARNILTPAKEVPDGDLAR